VKYYIIAGEASGDLHGANLIKALREEDPAARFRVWGGDLMQAAGGELVKHYRDLAFMGFWEVLLNIRAIMKNFAYCKRDVEAFRPDALVLIDYPGFNLRMAAWARRRGLRVVYYISPQLWAWHSSRVRHIKANVDQMLVILPFERDFYGRHGYAVDFVGHPLLDVIGRRSSGEDFRRRNALDERPIVALLPGSRRQEIKRVLPAMLEVVDDFPGFHFVIGAAPAIPLEFYGEILDHRARMIRNRECVARVHLAQGQTYDLMAAAAAAVVTSGTATLETALFGAPQVVVYRGGRLSYLIARRLIKVRYIALVNLIVEQPLVAELIQDELTPENLRREIDRLFAEDERRRILDGYGELRRRLGRAGASRRAAKLIAQKVETITKD
jgi:lipid-A-disaccharide synthase